MKYQRISPELRQYIETLTDEEKIMFRDVIDETIQRDLEMSENFEAAKINAEKLAAGMQRIVEEVVNIHTVVDRLNETLEDVRDNASSVAGALNSGPCWN